MPPAKPDFMESDLDGVAARLAMESVHNISNQVLHVCGAAGADAESGCEIGASEQQITFAGFVAPGSSAVLADEVGAEPKKCGGGVRRPTVVSSGWD